MSELRKQVRDHYEAQSLPATRVEAILAQGRDAAKGAATSEIPARHPRAGAPSRDRWRLALATAAALALLAGGAVSWFSLRSRPDEAALRGAVVAFLGDHPAYPMMSEQPAELHAWAIAHGAPAAFQIPDKLRALTGKGCTIIQAGGRTAYLLCFMAVDAAGKSDGGMVHLLVARRGDVRDAPPAGAPTVQAADGWSFASWVEGDIVYTVAAPAPVERLRRYVTTVPANVSAAGWGGARLSAPGEPGLPMPAGRLFRGHPVPSPAGRPPRRDSSSPKGIPNYS